MILSVHQPQYIPWLGYFEKIARSDCFVFLDLVQYKPHEFENRNKIRTKEGWMWLSLPIISKEKARQPICQCTIDSTSPWRREHWKSLQSCYGSAPFFDAHAPFFKSIYEKEWLNFCDLSITIINYILHELAITTPVRMESEIGTRFKSTARIIELCQKLGCDTYLSGSGGRAYLEEAQFTQAGLRLQYQEFTHPVYRQQFAKDAAEFLPYMSALDLLFNEGPQSGKLLGIS